MSSCFRTYMRCVEQIVWTRVHFVLREFLNIAQAVGAYGPGARSGARFSKVPKTFRAQKAICESTNRLFSKADLLTCFQGTKRQTDFEVWRLKSSPFLR